MDLTDWYAIDQTDRHLIAFAWHRGMVKVCQLQFWRDRLFIHFPYHPSERGVIARCEVGPGPEVTVSYAQTGFIVSHRVKYSHPSDGSAHFSQDGRVRTVVRNRAQRLVDRDGPDHLFSIDVQGLDQFAELPYDVYRGGNYGRCLFEMLVDGPPQAVHIVGRWRWLEDPRSLSRLRNPVAVRTPDGLDREHIALAPPPGSPLSGALMLIDLSRRQELSESNLVLFTGGFEESLSDPTVESSFLMMKYPAETFDFPSADYQAIAPQPS